MQQFDNSDAPLKAADTTDVSKSKVWERRIAIFLIVAALVGMLVCADLLIQAFITHQPLFELSGYGSSKSGFELLGYYASLFNIASYLALFIALNIPTLVGTEQKRLGYISASIGIVLLLLSFRLFFVSYKLEQEWWGYFSLVTYGMGLSAMTFSTLVSTERKRLSDILKFISLVLILAGAVLNSLELSN